MFLAISDWMFLPSVIAAALICTLVIIANLVYYVVRRRRTSVKPALSEIDILNALRDSKVFPVEYSNGWKLYDYVNGQQLWSHELQLPPSTSATAKADKWKAVNVFACFSKVKGSPQMVLNILKDAQKREHWTLNPRPLIKAESVPEASKNSGRQVVPTVCHDVIGIEVTDDNSGCIVRLLKRLWIPVRFRPMFAEVALVQRFWQREENGCCWLLEYDSDAEDWTFCLMQPIEGWFETDRCMLTIMSSFRRTQQQQKRKKEIRCEQMAVKLCSVRDYLQHRRVQSIPLVRLSLSYHDNEAVLQDGGSGVALTTPDESKSKDSKPSPLKDPTQEVSLLQKFKNMIELKREWYEAEKRRKALSSASVASNKSDVAPNVAIQNTLSLLRKLSPSKSVDQGGNIEAEVAKRIVERAKESLPEKGDATENGGKQEDDQKKRNVSKNTLRKRMPLLNEIGRSRTVEKSSDICEEQPEKLQELDADRKNKEPPSEELPGNSDASSRDSTALQKHCELESQFKLIAEATAVDLLTEKSLVSQLNITSTYKEQALTTGGWTYCGLEKDTVILQKQVDEVNPVYSYLGKGMVPASPKLVYEILKKPGNRRLFDDWLQKVEVLHEFESDMKIVHLYHEGQQSSNGKCLDLCLLQSEKCEGKKYIVTLQSVDWPQCKELENVTRFKMSSSGWIIEPVVKGKDIFSMVTYITQMELRSNQGSVSDFLEEFAAKQPMYIIALRQHLASLNETTSSGQPTIGCPKPQHGTGRNSFPTAAS